MTTTVTQTTKIEQTIEQRVTDERRQLITDFRAFLRQSVGVQDTDAIVNGLTSLVDNAQVDLPFLLGQYQELVGGNYNHGLVLEIMREHYLRQMPKSTPPSEMAFHPSYMGQRERLRRLLLDYQDV